MMAVNFLDSDNVSRCSVSLGASDLERILINLFVNNCSVVSVIPLSRLHFSQSNFFTVVYTFKDSYYTDSMDVFDLHKFVGRKDINLVRILPFI